MNNTVSGIELGMSQSTSSEARNKTKEKEEGRKELRI